MSYDEKILSLKNSHSLGESLTFVLQTLESDENDGLFPEKTHANTFSTHSAEPASVQPSRLSVPFLEKVQQSGLSVMRTTEKGVVHSSQRKPFWSRPDVTLKSHRPAFESKCFCLPDACPRASPSTSLSPIFLTYVMAMILTSQRG